AGAARRQHPVARGGTRARRQRRRVARRQLRDALEDRAPGRRVAEGRVVLERGGVERATHGGVQQQRLGLGGEHEQTVAMPVVERLLAEGSRARKSRRRRASHTAKANMPRSRSTHASPYSSHARSSTSVSLRVAKRRPRACSSPRRSRKLSISPLKTSVAIPSALVMGCCPVTR